jgi:hypothetical protein
LPSDGPHLSDEQLSQYPASEHSLAEAAHLESCTECRKRLDAIHGALAAYAEYRDSVRRPLLPPPPKPWASLKQIIELDEAGRRKPLRRWLWLPAAAAACVLAVLFVMARRPSEQASARATDLLVRSGRVTLSRSRMIELRARGRAFVRPAVLNEDAGNDTDAEMAHLRRLFQEARYSWREPLSSRSFQEWRGGLKHKRDSVSVIRQDGEKEYYRVRTDDPEGMLRSASLLIRAGDLRPTDGDFKFQGEDSVSMQEATAPAEPVPAPPAPFVKEVPVETPASAEDILHVLAALDAIGADAGEAIEVTQDAGHRHVVVRAGAVNPERRQQIARALQPLPHVTVDFERPAQDLPAAVGGSPQTYSNNIPAPLRERFEQKLGGPVAVQETTDRVLDASASLVARVHALEVLAGKFPPQIAARFGSADRMMLRRLRQHHTTEMQKSIAQIRAALNPLLENAGGAGIHAADAGTAAIWQAGVPALADSARALDRLLNRLLAGSYAQTSGEEMLRELGPDLQRLESSVQSQANSE